MRSLLVLVSFSTSVCGTTPLVTRTFLPVPIFHQDDPAWADDALADQTLGAAGCAVASVAMVLKYEGVDVTPKSLNAYLAANGGYTANGWIYWQKAADFTAGRINFTRSGGPDAALVEQSLRDRVPVIAKVLVGDVTHWVVVVGHEGDALLVNDPLDDGDAPVPLSRFPSGILALRIFRRTR